MLFYTDFYKNHIPFGTQAYKYKTAMNGFFILWELLIYL